jgi:hypothetical protein
MNQEKKYKTRLSWEVPEHKKVERGFRWYIIAGLIFLICIFFSFFTISNWNIIFLGPDSNFLFALIIIISTALILINESQDSLVIKFTLTPEGIIVGQRFYDYDQLKNFSVIYKPRQSIKQLYIEYKNPIRPRLSIPLRRMDALTVRNYLVKYLDEDLERSNPPLSEQLTQLFKL